MCEEKEKSPREDMIGAWTALAIVFIVMLTLTITIFGHWQFWMWFAIMGPVIAIVATTSEYLNSAKKCSNCNSSNESTADYCKKCGNKLLSANYNYREGNVENSGYENSRNVQYATQYSVHNSNQTAKIVKESKYCAICGQTIPMKAQFCSACGYSI
ncbi:MAG: hypothetical protein GY870_13050 [archaeon]|nr:hypothetical protein [archaeon]